MVIPAVQIAIDHLHHIGPPESVFANMKNIQSVLVNAMSDLFKYTMNAQ